MEVYLSSKLNYPFPYQRIAITIWTLSMPSQFIYPINSNPRWQPHSKYETKRTATRYTKKNEKKKKRNSWGIYICKAIVLNMGWSALELIWKRIRSKRMSSKGKERLYQTKLKMDWVVPVNEKRRVLFALRLGVFLASFHENYMTMR